MGRVPTEHRTHPRVRSRARMLLFLCKIDVRLTLALTRRNKRSMILYIKRKKTEYDP
jgi:hypothetical protein